MAKLPDFTDLGTAQALGAGGIPTLKMPTVYEDPRGQAGIALGNKLGNVADTVFKLYLKQQEEVDTTAVADAINKAKQLELEYKYGKDGALKKLGADASSPDYVKNNMQSLDDGIANISKDLTERQQARFKLHASAISMDFESDLYRHSGEQFKVWQEATDKTSVQTFTQSGATEAMSPSPNVKNIQSNLEGILEVVTRNADRKGLAFNADGTDSTALTSFKQQATSDYYESLIQSALGANQPNTAKGLFFSHIKELDPKVVASIGPHLQALDKENNLRMTAQAAGDYVMAKGMDETAALSYVREKYTGEEEANAVQEVRNRFSETKIIEAQQEKQVSDTAWKIVAAGGGRKSIPPLIWNSLDGKEQTQIKDYLHSKAKQAEAEAEGKEIKTDTPSYYALKKMSVNNPEAFISMNLLVTPEFSKLNRQDQQEIIGLQATVAQKKPDELKEVMTLDSQVSVSIAETGIKDKNNKVIAEGKIREAIDAEARIQGKELNADARQKIIDRMLISGEVVKGEWYDKDTRLYKVIGTEDAAKFVPDIPKDERAKIKAAIIADKKPVTEVEIMRRYKLRHGLQ